ncbi:MAG: hypothetical protein HY079_00520 [Elusimicrobia bacterium]|nr:hypothetical protein [Elusimicrobiota bacterium]
MIRAFALLAALSVARPASSAPVPPDAARLAAALRAAGFELPPGADALVPAPPPAPPAAPGAARRVDMAGLLDRHWSTTDAFDDAAGRTLVAGTLDLAGDGWLVATPSGGSPVLVRIGAGMRGEWRAGGRTYRVTLDVNIFRARLNNVIVVRDLATGDEVYRRRIIDLFRATYAAGLPVTLAGRDYRLFLAHMPDASRDPAVPSDALGLCLIYDVKDPSGRHVRYDFYRFPAESLKVPTSLSLFGGDRVLVRASADLGSLDILP